jgi:uncharacterized protein (TIGR02271 family)
MANRDDDLKRSTRNLGDKTERAADNAFRTHHDEPATTGDRIGEATGGVAGAATGAALGSLGGPIGTVIGGIAGAVGGWWTGRAVSEAASTFDESDDEYYRTQFGSSQSSSGTSGRARSYDEARPAYQVGYLAGMNPDYQNRQFDEVESDLERGWSSSDARKHGEWSDVRHYARDAYDRGRQRMTLSEEQLSIGKRQVQAGEVGLRKTVETEHVSESVPLMREEVTIERRPISADAARGANIEIGEDEIRIPVMEEQAVVEKRTVATEEVILNKRTVTEQETVEADLRRERLDVDDSTTTRHAGSSGTSSHSTSGAADRATNSGLGDRLADKADNLKDRVDGNPASRPGPDATDSRI